MVQGGTTLFWGQITVAKYRFCQNLYLSKALLGPYGQGPPTSLKAFEHQARQNLSTFNSAATFAKTAAFCNTINEKCQESLKSTFKKVKSQIQKDSNPEKSSQAWL